MKKSHQLPAQDDAREAVFAQFRTQLGEYGTSGQMPEAAVQSVRDELALQSGRLRSHGLSMETRLTPEYEIQYITGMGCGVEGEGMHSLNSYSQGIHRRRTFLRDGKKLGRRSDEVCLAATLAEWENRADPQVNEFYWWESPDVPRSRGRKFLLWYCILLGIPALLLSVAAALAGAGLWGLFGVFSFCTMLAAIPLPFVGIIFLIIRESKKIREMSYTQKNRKPGQELMDELFSIDSTLSERYLEEVALTLSRRYMLRNDAFRDVLDTKYRNVICPLAVSRQDGGLEITLELHVCNTLYDGKKLRDSREILRMTLWHEGAFTLEEPYSQAKFDRWTIRSMERH